MDYRSFRAFAVVSVAVLLLGALVAAPADAKKKKKKGCAKVSFVEPESPSEARAEVPKGKVARVTDAATEDDPFVIEYEHGPAFWDLINQEPIVEDTKFFNIQVDSAAPTASLNIRQEWPIPSVSDMDLYLWDGPTGTQVEVSGAFNGSPVPVPIIGETGGMGYESISDVGVVDCGGLSIESRAFWTAGEPNMVLKVWLGS